MINKVILLGNVGNDPDYKEFENGKVCSFSLATSESYTDKSGEKKQITEWHSVQCFGKLADVVNKYVIKGMTVYVEGKKKTREYEKDGQKHYAVSIVCETLKMVSSKKESSHQTEHHSQEEQIDHPVNDDLPF